MKKTLNLLQFLEDKNIEAFAVGGVVRDQLLGREPKDIDFASPLSPPVLRRRLGAHILNDLTDSTIEYGVLHFIFEDVIYEIASFRADLEAKRDTKVIFVTDMSHDAWRRDFTINALYMDINGKIHDPTKLGLIAIKHNMLDTCGVTISRMAEDPSRILRAIRFMAEGFKPTNELNEFLKRDYTIKVLLDKVSQEVKTKSFLKILEKGAKDGILLLKKFGLLEYLIPELKMTYEYNQRNPHHQFDLFTHLYLTALHISMRTSDPILILTGLLHDIGKPGTASWNDKKSKMAYIGHEATGADISVNILERMKFSNKDVLRVSTLIRHHMRLHMHRTDKSFRRIRWDLESVMERRNITGLLQDIVTLWRADNFGKNMQEETDEIIFPMLPQNPVSSDDVVNYIQEAGFDPKWIGRGIRKTWHIILKNPSMTRLNVFNGMKSFVKNKVNLETIKV